jgi:ubiquinone/menaquinone biosynthesis C-methylase UbiE
MVLARLPGSGAASPVVARGTPPEFVAGNYFDKYHSSNPIHLALVGGFLRRARELLAAVSPRSILEVGCGNGDFAAALLGPGAVGAPSGPSYVGIDVSREQVAQAKDHHPGADFLQASAYALPFAERGFDLVIACEVFEHLEDPPAALREVQRVCASHLLLSVPWEPCWRVLNVLRGKYLAAWGNTPGHLQHFSRAAIRSLVASRFQIVAERHPLPWTMLLARRRDTR